MGLMDDWRAERAERQRIADKGGFSVKAAYLGGHPDLTQPDQGRLVLDHGELSFRRRLGWKNEESVAFTMAAAAIRTVQFVGAEEMRQAPKGFWVPLPIAWIPGYGTKRDHPVPGAMGGKLTKLLILDVELPGGESKVVFGNSTGLAGPLAESTPEQAGLGIANKITAAAHAARIDAGATSSTATQRLSDLERLAHLRDTGVLSEHEFQSEKAKLLRGE